MTLEGPVTDFALAVEGAGSCWPQFVVRDLKAMLAPYPSDEMIAWPVSPRVGNVKNNDASLIEPMNAA